MTESDRPEEPEEPTSEEGAVYRVLVNNLVGHMKGGTVTEAALVEAGTHVPSLLLTRIITEENT